MPRPSFRVWTSVVVALACLVPGHGPSIESAAASVVTSATFTPTNGDLVKGGANGTFRVEVDLNATAIDDAQQALYLFISEDVRNSNFNDRLIELNVGCQDFPIILGRNYRVRIEFALACSGNSDLSGAGVVSADIIDPATGQVLCMAGATVGVNRTSGPDSNPRMVVIEDERNMNFGLLNVNCVSSTGGGGTFFDDITNLADPCGILGALLPVFAGAVPFRVASRRHRRRH